MENSKSEIKVLFIVDTSGSMHGEKIGAVNAAITECLGVLRKVKTGGKNVKVGYMEFNEKRISSDFGEDLSNKTFEISESEDGFYPITSFACMYDGLYDIIKNTEEIDENLCLVLITDAKPVDFGEYSESLERVKSLSAFRKAEKLAALVGNNLSSIENDVLEFVMFSADKVVGLSNLSVFLSKMPMLMIGQYEQYQEKYRSIFVD